MSFLRRFRIFPVLPAVFMLVACSISKQPQTHSFYTYFDTVVTVSDYSGLNEKDFGNVCDGIEEILTKYNRYMDIYHEYSGINNLCTLNINAGNEIEIDDELADFLEFAKKSCYDSYGKVNVMLGSVLSIWHDFRISNIEQPASKPIPLRSELENAACHTSVESLVVDRKKGTACIVDPQACIDVGAVGKGYVAERIAEYLIASGYHGFVINLGGNVRTVGTKNDGSDWVVGIRNPDKSNESFATKLCISDMACVTSGSYERFYEVNGHRYHHIIDPDTLECADYFDSVTVVTRDSAYADMLSTMLFCMSYEDGLAYAERCGDFEALWINKDGTMMWTSGMENYFSET